MRRKAANRKKAARRRWSAENHVLDAAIRFVEEAGGISAATAALEKIQKIKTL